MNNVKRKAEIGNLDQSSHLAIKTVGAELVSARGKDPDSLQDLSWELGKERTGEVAGRVGLWQTCTAGLFFVSSSLPFPWWLKCLWRWPHEWATETLTDLCKSNFKMLAEFTHFLWLSSCLTEWSPPPPPCNFNIKYKFYQVFLCNQDIKMIPTFLFENGSSETQ